MNEFAVTADDVGSGLTNCASALEVAGNTLQESAAMVTGITEVTQDASKAGNALRTLSLRLRGTSSTVLEDLGEDTEGLIENTSKLQEKIEALTGVDIMEDENTYKSTYQIMSEIAEVWDELDDISQASLLETIAGKNRSSDVSALLSNWEQVEEAMVAATDAEGTAAEENEKYLESLQGRIDKFTASWQALSNAFLDDSFLKGIVDFGTGALDVITNLVDTFGTLPTVLTAVMGALSIKNVGELINQFQYLIVLRIEYAHEAFY